MRISKATKKTMSIAMAMAVAVTSITAVPANTASAKSKKVTARAYFAVLPSPVTAHGLPVTVRQLRL